MFSKKVITLNIEASSIKVLAIKGKKVKRWGSMPLEAGWVGEGLVLKPEAVGQAINALFKSMRMSRNKVIVSITGQHSIPRILTLPRIESSLVPEAVRRGAKSGMPVPLEELYLSWQPIGMRDHEQAFFVLGVPRNLIDAVVQALVQSRVKPYIMELKPLALARVANREEALIIDLEPDSCGITLVAGGIPAIMRTITPRREAVILEDNIQRLIEEVLRTIEFYNQEHPEYLFSLSAPVILTGELSGDAATIDLIKSGLGTSVELLTTQLKCPPEFNAASYAANIGLAFKRVKL